MIAWQAGDKCRLDGVLATVLCVHGKWAWVIKDKGKDGPETVATSLLSQ